MNALDLLTRTIPSGTWGNLQFEEFDFTLANGDNIGSTHKLAQLPAGIRPIDGFLHVTDAGPASTTLDIGFVAVPGESTAQDDPDWLFSLVNGAATGFTRRTANNVPFTFQQKMYLQVTVQGANQNGPFVGKVGLFYRYLGNL